MLAKLKIIFALGILIGLVGCDSTTPDAHVERALKFHEEHELRAATVEIKIALRSSPDHVVARILLGDIHLEMGDYAGALHEFERVLDLGEPHGRIQIRLLRSRLGLGRYQEVIADLEQQDTLAPGLQTLLAEAYRQARDFAKAQSLYEMAIAADTTQTYAYLGLGLIAWEERRLTDARAMLQAAVSADPRNFNAWLSLGEVELLLSDFGSATTAFEMAAALPGSRVQGHLGLARAALIAGDTDTAEAWVDAAIEIAPRVPMTHYLRGLVHFQKGEFADAEKALQQVQSLDPSHQPTLFLMGVNKYRLGQLSQAQLNLRQFVAQNPNNESAHKFLAGLLLQEGDHDAVIELLRPIQILTQDPQVLALLSSSYLATGQTSMATDLLARAVDLAPDMEVFRSQLAFSLMASDERDIAVAGLEETVDLGVGSFPTDYLLTMIYLREGNIDAADTVIKRMVSNNPEEPIGYNLQAAVHIARNDLTATIASFERALEVDPSFLHAVVNLARIDEIAGDFSAAERRYEEFLVANENNVAAMTLLARLVYRQDDLSRAETILMGASEVDPTALEPHILLARIHLLRENIKEADKAAAVAISLAPDNPDTLLLSGQIALIKGDASSASLLARRLQSVLPDRMDPDTRFNVGLFQASAGRRDLASLQFAKVLDDTNGLHTGALVNLTRIQIAEHDLEAASNGLAALLERDVDSQTTDLLAADLAVGSGNLARAADLYATLAEGGLREAMLKHAATTTRLGRFEDGRKTLLRWLDSHPDDIGAELLLAENLTRSADNEQAIARYESILERAGEQAVVLNNLAWLYYQENDERAEQVARRAMELLPDSGAPADTLGWILLNAGQTEAATRHLTRAESLSPRDPGIKYHLAVAYQRAGDLERAKRTIEQSLDLADFSERPAAIALLQEL